MATADEPIRSMGVAVADRGRWYPPDYWTASDGCSGVKDYVFGRACRRHDWRWRYSMWWVAEWLTRFGVVGLLALAVLSVFAMLASNLFYLFEQYGDLVRSKHRANPLLWLFPIWRTAAVTVTGAVFFNCMGDGRK